MTRKRSKQGPGADDFHAARARLKEIGDGLGSLFETVTSLIEDAAENGLQDTRGTNQKRPRMPSVFGVQMGTVDDALGTRQAPKPRRAKPSASRNTAPVIPVSAEHFFSDSSLMVIVTLGAASADTIIAQQTPAGLILSCTGWAYTIEQTAGLNPAPTHRAERNGFLTLHFTADTPAQQPRPENEDRP